MRRRDASLVYAYRLLSLVEFGLICYLITLSSCSYCAIQNETQEPTLPPSEDPSDWQLYDHKSYHPILASHLDGTEDMNSVLSKVGQTAHPKSKADNNQNINRNPAQEPPPPPPPQPQPQSQPRPQPQSQSQSQPQPQPPPPPPPPPQTATPTQALVGVSKVEETHTDSEQATAPTVTSDQEASPNPEDAMEDEEDEDEFSQNEQEEQTARNAHSSTHSSEGLSHQDKEEEAKTEEGHNNQNDMGTLEKREDGHGESQLDSSSAESTTPEDSRQDSVDKTAAQPQEQTEPVKKVTEPSAPSETPAPVATESAQSNVAVDQSAKEQPSKSLYSPPVEVANSSQPPSTEPTGAVPNPTTNAPTVSEPQHKDETQFELEKKKSSEVSEEQSESKTEEQTNPRHTKDLPQESATKSSFPEHGRPEITERNDYPTNETTTKTAAPINSAHEIGNNSEPPTPESSHPRESQDNDRHSKKPGRLFRSPKYDDERFKLENDKEANQQSSMLPEISFTPKMVICLLSVMCIIIPLIYQFRMKNDFTPIQMTQPPQPQENSTKEPRARDRSASLAIQQLRNREIQLAQQNKSLKMNLELGPLRASIKKLQQENLESKLQLKKKQMEHLVEYKQKLSDNKKLSQRVEMNRYWQLKLIRNLIDINLIPNVIDYMEYHRLSEDTKESICRMEVETKFLEEQMEMFSRLTTDFQREYKSLEERKLSEEKRRQNIA